jgi:hypothetical protein
MLKLEKLGEVSTICTAVDSYTTKDIPGDWPNRIYINCERSARQDNIYPNLCETTPKEDQSYYAVVPEQAPEAYQLHPPSIKHHVICTGPDWTE